MIIKSVEDKTIKKAKKINRKLGGRVKTFSLAKLGHSR